MKDYKEYFFNNKIKDINTYIKKKQNDLIHVIVGEDNKYITPYFKHKINIVENNKVNNIVNIFNQNLQKNMNIFKAKDIINQETLELADNTIKSFKGLTSLFLLHFKQYPFFNALYMPQHLHFPNSYLSFIFVPLSL